MCLIPSLYLYSKTICSKFYTLRHANILWVNTGFGGWVTKINCLQNLHNIVLFVCTFLFSFLAYIHKTTASQLIKHFTPYI